jgi:hypothetical protein
MESLDIIWRKLCDDVLSGEVSKARADLEALSTKDLVLLVEYLIGQVNDPAQRPQVKSVSMAMQRAQLVTQSRQLALDAIAKAMRKV